MKKTTLFQRLGPHLLFVLALFLLASIYFLPAWQGKVINMPDTQQSLAAAREIREVKEQTGHAPLWTNVLFSGMPSYMVSFPNPTAFVGMAALAVKAMFPVPVILLFMQMLGMYILMIVLGAGGWLGVLGAVTFAFGTYNLVSIEAGHISKVYALAYAPGILAGVIQALRGRYVAGMALTALFLCLEFGSNHLQITYYLFLILGIYVVFRAVELVREGNVRQLALGLAALLVAGAIGAGSWSTRLLAVNQYSKETIRGRSELTATTTSQGQDKDQTNSRATSDGLTEDYAFTYSYGKLETFTLLVPGFIGGGSGGGLTTSSNLYQAMTGRGVDPAAAKQFVEQGAPVYWGDQPIVGGPAYAGAIMVFLFVLGMLISRNRLKWFALGVTLLLIMIAWGKNFMLLNGFLFNYFPYFNKFRAMTMTLALVQIFIGMGAVLGLQEIARRNLTFADLKKPFLISLGATGGLAMLFALLGGTLFDFRAANDTQVFTQIFGDANLGNEMLRALISDRQSLLRSDAFRSFIFIGLAAGLLWLYLNKRLKPALFYPLLVGLVVIDLFLIDKRWVNNADFVSKSVIQNQYEPTAADQQILQDTAMSYRVLDNTTNFMSSNNASQYHKSIGGYNPARLRRYDELMQYGFQKNPVGILNMLNARYVIRQDQNGPAVQHNAEALGNAWFVGTARLVDNADQEMAALQSLNPKDTAVVDKRFANQLAGLNFPLNTTGNAIRLTSYQPEHLKYSSQASSDQLAVFSEVYYRGDSDWNAYIDGRKVPHFRANYVLRAMRVPAGKHIIEFKFEPPVIAVGNTIDLVANSLLLGLLVLGLVVAARSKSRDEEDDLGASAPESRPATGTVAEPAKTKTKGTARS
ncbi:YfhO family protein [Nibrella saemangeumensis]|uniref:YfhO family protein n=1 Tax=Nibrella saemangeumensis TaxID=1084526 RepID=A0ABP8NQ74_9BACT